MAKEKQTVFGLLLTLIGDYGHADEIRIGNGLEEGVTYIEARSNDCYDVYDAVRGGRQGVKPCLSAIVAAQAALKKIATSLDEYQSMVDDLYDRIAKCPEENKFEVVVNVGNARATT